MDQTIELLISFDTTSTYNVEEVAELYKQLQDELPGLEVEGAAFVSTGETKKAGDPITWGPLLVTLAASGGVLTTLITVLHSWLSRHERRSLTLEIDGDKLEITGISAEEQRRLVDAWLQRHGGSALPDG